MSQPTPSKRKINRKTILLGIIALLVICILCAVVVQFLPDTTPASPIEPTDQIEITTAPNQPPEPTPTAEPSSTPVPTNTPEPTNTPLPTSTPTEVPSPTPLPEPILLSGSGDNVIDFENPFDVAIVHITGNASSRHFAVTNMDANGNTIDLLVNTTDPYNGFRPLDFMDTHTTRFEIKASGEWTIEVLPLLSARALEVPGSIEGNGDEVIVLKGGTPDVARITGNQDGRHFAVIGYGSMADLLVNTTDPYEGTVSMASDTLVLEIKAEGPWTIEISAK